MKRLRFIIMVGIVAFGVLVLIRALPGGRRTNVLLLTLDTTRADRIGCYGYDIALTPVLDGLAQQGVLFEQAHTCVPITLPAHASIFTGLYPPEHALRTNGKNALDPGIPTLAEILSARGYTTGGFIASPVLAASYGLARGFQTYDDYRALPSDDNTPRMRLLAETDPQGQRYRPGDVMADAALQWLNTTALPALRKKNQPFFCWVHFYDPHLPGHWHNDEFQRRFSHQYDAEVAFMDSQIGRLIEFLNANGLDKDTLVIAVGDHGEGLGDNGEDTHGFFLYSTLHVPMIFSQPGRLPAGFRVPALLSIVDLFPTILDLLGVKPADPAAGSTERSFADAVMGKPAGDRPLYAESDLGFLNFGWSPLRALITPRWKYIRAPRPELYDREKDRGDLNDLSATLPQVMDEQDQLLASIESAMKIGTAAEVTLSVEEQKRLASLGYLAGGSRDTTQLSAVRKDLVDVKDMKAIVTLQGDVRVMIETGDFSEQTLAAARRLVEVSPDCAVFHCWLAIVLDAQGKSDEALAGFQEALRLLPDGATTHNNLAMFYVRHGRLDDAIKHFEEALRLNPQDDTVRFNLSLAYNEAGTNHGRNGDLAGAIDYLAKAIGLSPELAEAHQNLGAALMGQGNIEGAARSFEEAVRLKPDYAVARHNLAIAREMLAGQK